MAIRKILPEEAYGKCDVSEFSFETTADLEELTRYIGQDRALEAVQFGISMRHRGFNLFVVGAEGSGRHSVVQSFIDRQANMEPMPPDWCYVFNFEEPHKPLALQFAPQQGPIFKKEMNELIDALKITLPTVFEGDDYRARRRILDEQLKNKIDQLYENLIAKGKEHSIAVVRSEQGLIFTPMDEQGKPMDIEAFQKLPPEQQKEIEQDIERLHADLQKSAHQIGIWNREAKNERRKLKKETARQSVSHLIETLKSKYKGQEKIIHYLEAAEEQLTEKADDFLYQPEVSQENIVAMMAGPPTFDQYDVNVLVTQLKQGAPVVYEDLPTFHNLHGRVEHQAKMGMLLTNFSLIKSGALHRANGGYLIIDARRLLMQPFAYEGLKRTLRSGVIHMEPVEHFLGLMSTITLEPEAIPLQVKVVLIGEPIIYYLLNYYDPEFKALFKVQADFEDDMERTPLSEQRFAALLAGLAKEKQLLPLHKLAVAKAIETAARFAGNSKKLSLHIRAVADLVKEADYLARKRERKWIEAEDIENALEAAKRRSGRIRDRILEATLEDVRHIATSGVRTGQVNGLSVIDLGSDLLFGFPTRITATTRPGKGDIIDIEREVDLGGPIHSKGVMILSAFLSARYARNIPLGLQASLVFEQSYGGVEGDSASCAELCALLSSLADLPIKQALAVTGSISQQGDVQAVGGINEKIEGFFDLCAARGLSGAEGVLLPATNVRHLMLRRDVIEAMEAQTFNIYAIQNVDEAISLLTGWTAGERDSDGNYPGNSINGRVEEALVRFAVDLQQFEKGEEGGTKDGDEEQVIISR